MSLQLPEDPQIMTTKKESGSSPACCPSFPCVPIPPTVVPCFHVVHSTLVYTEAAGLDTACLLIVCICSKPWEKPYTSCALEVTLSLPSVIGIGQFENILRNWLFFHPVHSPPQEEGDPGLGADRQTDMGLRIAKQPPYALPP